MNKIAVGEKLFVKQTRYPEGMIFEYTESGPMLIIAFHNPTDKEIEGLKTGKYEIGFYEVPPVIFIVAKIQGMGGWMDAPFSVRLYDNKGVNFNWSDPIEENQGLALHLILVDADTGIVKAQRLIGASTKFSWELRQAVLQQLENPFDKRNYDQTIDTIYRSYNSDDLAMHATNKFRK